MIYGYAAFLIDTHEKNGATLLDHLSVIEIDALTCRCRNAGVPVALAGSLGLTEIEQLRGVNPDWIAVRGAACKGGRGGEVSFEQVRALKIVLSGSPPVATGGLSPTLSSPVAAS
jgi:hypothetical protein